MAQLTPEQESFKNEILEQVKGLLKNVASKEDKETLDASIKAFTDRIESASSKQDLESLKADVASIGLIVKKLEEVGKPEAKQDVRSQIAKWQEKNKKK